MGYTNVRHYHGGLADWTESGLPVVSGIAPGGPAMPASDGKGAAAAQPAEISADEISRRLKDTALHLVDVQTADSYLESHISGAISIPLEELEAKAHRLLPRRDAEVVVYASQTGSERSDQAVGLLRELGYTNVRVYRGSFDPWAESALPKESEPSVASPEARPSRFATLAEIHRAQWGSKLVELIDRQSTSRLFLIWMAIALSFGVIYWLAGLMHHSGLVENGQWLDGSLHGLLSAIYFSFVTVTSVGYGDIVPRGVARIAAVTEAILGLLVFGAVISKFVSRRQDQVMAEIHRVTFDERLDRIQTNLHTVLSEFQHIAMLFSDGKASAERTNARLESTTLVFLAELRTVHSLLYRPQKTPDEPVMAGILASLASALNALDDCLRARPDGQERSPLLTRVLRTTSSLASEICADCVPVVYAPILTMWMDRIHEIAGRIA
jgi:rhodanese-related sulfurtransferase